MTSGSVNGATRRIRIARLRLRGTLRDYQVSFLKQGALRPLSVIAGEINTGKTSVLEFIDYCLGAGQHPRHQEVLAQVRSAQLEVRLAGAPYVLERAVGEPSSSVTIFPGTLDTMGHTAPERRPIRPAGDPTSLSTLLLSYCGLEGVELREAPTKAESKTDPLSFRDLMWLDYLPNERLDNKNLLHEGNYMQRLKLRQVVDVVFGVHDDAAVVLGQRVSELEGRVQKARAELQTLRAFLQEQQPRPVIELELLTTRAQDQIAEVNREISEIDAQARAQSDFAEQARRRHRAAAIVARRAAGTVRDRETLLARLMPLRAQYAEDLRKLVFLSEADQLFDPLRVTTCPACLSALPTAPNIVDGHCTLCRAELPIENVSSDGSPPAIDVETEVRSTRARLKELTEYIEQLDVELPALQEAARGAADVEATAAATMDEEIGGVEAISPYLAQRDDAMRRRREAERELEAARAALRLHAGVEQRERRLERLSSNLDAARSELTSVRTVEERRNVVAALSRRFGEILAAFRYPKLHQPLLDEQLVPHVRGSRYSEASSGARTLISLAWQLSIFERAVELGAAHPGFLMIDSPQKNLGSGNADEAEFQDARIVSGFYSHLHEWLNGLGRGAQVIVVDNAPPVAAEQDVVVRYTRDPQRAPYGLIDNETG